MSDLCPTCGAYWRCEHQRPESAGLLSISVDLAQASMAQHTTARDPRLWKAAEVQAQMLARGENPPPIEWIASGLDFAERWEAAAPRIAELFQGVATALNRWVGQVAEALAPLQRQLAALACDLEPTTEPRNRAERRQRRFRPGYRDGSYQRDIHRWAGPHTRRC